MSDIKVGAKIKLPIWNKYFKVVRIEGDTLWLASEVGSEYSYPVDDGWEIEATHFPLYSEEQAVKLLEERGYEVKAPPEPLKGKGYVYKFPNVKGAFIYNKRLNNTNGILIAIVDWTEGDGIGPYGTEE